MAAATSPPSPLLFLCTIYCLFVLCIHMPCASSLNFSYNFSRIIDNPCGSKLQCKGDAFFANNMIELTKNVKSSPSNNSTGRVWNTDPVPLWDAATGELASFSTSFSFRITKDPDNTNYTAGDGMAFFLASYSNGSVLGSSGDEGGYLGLFNNTNHFNATGNSRVVAVEFDTFPGNPWDELRSHHVGIDLNSIVSVESMGIGGSGLASRDPNLRMTATVSYDNSTKVLAVDLDIHGTPYLINTTVDLKLFLPNNVAVGFSAATGWSSEMHRVESWSFSSTLKMKVATAPAPSTTLLLKVLAPIASVTVCAAVALLLWLWQQRRRNIQPQEVTGDNESESDEEHGEADFERGAAGPRRYHYRELAAATGDFAEENMLGRGGFGSVYMGCLAIGSNGEQQVAIKKFSPESTQSRKEFEAEVKIISRLRHRHIVQLLGWCDSRKGLLLVYEFMPEGSLDKHIHSTQRVLTWSERYNIILGLGLALRYLHQEWEQCVVHGDIKPSNIMLDSSYNTKLGDFGLARLGDHGTDPQTTMVKGTKGYIDPEFVNTSRRSTESDVYSFGVVVLEIISGRPPLDRQDLSFMLIKWVWSLYSEGKTLAAADVRLRTGDEAAEWQMERALVVGLWCTLRNPEERPSVAEAMHVLQSEDKLPDLPPQQMYRMAATLSFAVEKSGGASGSSFSSGVRSSATTGTTRSSEPSAN